MSSKINLCQLQAYKGSLTHFLPEVLVLYLITFKFTVILELIFAYGGRNVSGLSISQYEFLVDSASATVRVLLPMLCCRAVYEINQVIVSE